VVRLEIKSKAGGALRVLSPWKSVRVNGQPLTPDSRGVVELATTAGGVYTLQAD